MKHLLFILLLTCNIHWVAAQNTDIRPNAIHYPSLTTAQINSLNSTTDGLREGTTAYNKELNCLLYFDGCSWVTFDKNFLNDQNPIQEITAPNPQTNSFFGAAMAIYGKVLLVSAPLMDVSGNTDFGEVYIYRKNGCT